jgi:hypothetical protein
MISSLWPLAVKGEIKRLSNNFVPQGKGKEKQEQGKKK